MFNRLEIYLNDNEILSKTQFGFRKSYSTTYALSEIIKSILGALDSKSKSYGIFCDLSKAFDCVNHDILLAKLKSYGIDGMDLLLCQSYLSARQQVVLVNGTISMKRGISVGVPQGSILGPLLFLIYINDISSCTIDENIDIYMFADDISLLINCNKNTDIKIKTINVITKITKWFECNNLLLNTTKTNLTNFSLATTNIDGNGIKDAGESLGIKITDKIKFLGIEVDSKLTWKGHIDGLAGRLSSACYAIKKVRELCGKEAARTVYFAYFHSLMTYGLLVWGNASTSARIFRLQKRAIRSILGSKPRDSCRDLFSTLGIVTFTGEYILQCLIYVKKNRQSFPTLAANHNYNTRHGGNIMHPPCRLAKVSKSYLCIGIKMFNKLNDELKDENINTFKKKVKIILMKKSYYNLSEAMEEKQLM